LAGFETSSSHEPVSEMAGFAPDSEAVPVSGMAGFDSASRKYRPTVSRCRPSSRAIRRRDQPCSANVKIECCKLTLSRFIAPLCGIRRSRRNPSLKVAGFHSLSPGRF
jgi:hypothetical protein